MGKKRYSSRIARVDYFFFLPEFERLLVVNCRAIVGKLCKHDDDDNDDVEETNQIRFRLLFGTGFGGVHTTADRLGLLVRVHSAGPHQTETGPELRGLDAGPVRVGQQGGRDPTDGDVEQSGHKTLAGPGLGRAGRRRERTERDAVQTGSVVRVVLERVRHHVRPAVDQFHTEPGPHGQRHVARERVRQFFRTSSHELYRRRGGHVETVVRVQHRLRLSQVGVPGFGAHNRPTGPTRTRSMARRTNQGSDRPYVHIFNQQSRLSCTLSSPSSFH